MSPARRPSQTRSPRQARARTLFVLTDQGKPCELPIGSFGVKDERPGWNPYADNFVAANRASLSAIDVTPELAPAGSEIAMRLRPGARVGAVPLYSPDTRKVAGGVVVRPRFGWDGIGLLLQRIGWSAAPQVLEMPLVPGSAREVPPWVLAGPILQRLSLLIREIRAGFRLHEEVRQTPRGQVAWREYAVRHLATGDWHRFPCRYSDLGPDLALQQFLKWGVWQVRQSLSPFGVTDVVARRLLDQAEELLYVLRDISPRPPDKRTLDRLLRSTGLPTAVLQRGIQALGWLVDERGLAGQADADGLAWSLAMHRLFERWVEWLVRLWARETGGEVRSAASHETLVPLQWSRPGHGSLGSLEPDIVVHRSDEVVIVDAKYKGHFEELDDHRWMEIREELREAHRHDLHQVLAYAALHDAPNITAALAYPLQPSTYQNAAQRGQAIHEAHVSQGGRTLKLVLLGVPLELPPGKSASDVVGEWHSLTEPANIG